LITFGLLMSVGTLLAKITQPSKIHQKTSQVPEMSSGIWVLKEREGML